MADSIFKKIGSAIKTELDNKILVTETTEFMMVDGQTNIDHIYNPEAVQIFSEGFLLQTSSYTATNGTNITLNYSADAGEKITIHSSTI